MIKNNLIKKICAVSCALVFLTQLSLPSTTILASTYSTSSFSENIKPTIATNNKLTAGLNNALAANSTEVLSKNLKATASPAISYGVTGSPTVGSTIDIVVNASSASNLYGASLDFVFDSSLLQVQSVDKGSLFSSDTTKVPVIKKGNGQVNIAITLSNATTTITGSGSIVIIKAKVLKAGTVNMKTTNNIDNLYLSGFTSCIKLADNSGNKIGYTFVDKSITTQNAPVTIQPGSYEENNSNISYVGTWAPQTNSGYSGGSAKVSTTNGSYYTFKFYGTGINLYTLKASTCGISKITLDDQTFTVDNYSSTFSFKNLFFSKNNLNLGEHTIKVEVTNTKNATSTNYYSILDSFNII